MREGAKSYANAEDALSVVPEFALRADVAMEGDALDSEFLVQIGNENVAFVSPLGWEHIKLTGEYRWPKP
ncbi:hypothetical protein FHR87_003919 [Azomonas macrocytogenes]|uniref:Uncharacterized protein n=1 Tax=Azomonas macrocytogenes TaxID=69962 RepID=A0A839TAI9_AZOMA|nr:hypothetical protein [Azomonas macrocytogenes]